MKQLMSICVCNILTYMSVHPSLLILMLAVLVSTANVVLEPGILTEEIGESIFHENKLYMILVTDESVPADNVIIMFNEFCRNEQQLCTVLSPEVDRFLDFKQFIGSNLRLFFAILDVQRRKKYVLPYIEGMTINDISIFQAKFEQGILEPFYNSEEPDKEPYERCEKLVSKTLTQFLESSSEIKVVFLYTMHEACEVCGEMLRQYADLAEKLYDKDIVKFGYYDIFRNDHPRITDEILPYFLIFTKSKEPYGLPAEKFHELEETIIQIAIRDTDISLDKFRQEYTLRFDERGNKIKPDSQYEINYKVGQNGDLLKHNHKAQEHIDLEEF